MTSIPYRFDDGPPLYLRSVKLVGVLLLIAFAALIIFAVSSLAFGAPMLALCAIVVVGYAALRWPTQTVVVTLVLIPLSRFLSLLVFATTGSAIAVRGSQLVKDELIIVLLVAVANLAFIRRRAPTLYLFDILIGAYLALSFLYLFYPGDEVASTPLLAKVLALRQDALYFMAYFIGRGIDLDRRTLKRMLNVLVALSLVLASVAIFQTAMPSLSNAAFNWLGFSKFMALIGSPHETLVVRSRGIAGADFSRSSSLFLADLGLAYFQVLIIPFAASLYFMAKNRREQVGYGLFLVLMIGVLATTITRSALLAAGIGLIFVTAHTAGYVKAWVVILALALLAMPVILATHLSPDSITALFSTKEGSAIAHVSLLQTALQQFKDHPFGMGLGNGSHVANLVARYGVNLPVSATESWYLQIALEMGVIALVLFTLMLLVATGKAVLASFQLKDHTLKVVTVAVGAAGVSLLVAGIFQPVWAGTHVSYLFWLFAGIAARATTLEREWDIQDHAAELPDMFRRRDTEL